MTIDEIIEQFHQQGLRLEPENDGKSVDVLCDVLEDLCKDFAAISYPTPE